MTEVASRLLHQKVPGLEALHRPVSLVVRPTPVTRELALQEHWSLSDLWIKRDDLTSSVYGGSKVRNLEYFFGDAIANGANSVATMGPLGSHQVLAMATYAKLHGLHARALLTPQPDVKEAGLNERLLPQIGGEFYRCEKLLQVPKGFILTRFVRHQGQLPYWIPPGSHHPIGVLGIIEGVLEVAAAIENGELPMVDDIVVPTGTCATAVGVWLGLAMAGLPIRTVAVRMVPMFITGPGKMRKLANKTLTLLRKAGYKQSIELGELLWLDEYAGPGYGLGNADSDTASADVSKLSDFRTEVTYTAKTLAIFPKKTLKNRKVLFWNTYSAVDPDPQSLIAGVKS